MPAPCAVLDCAHPGGLPFRRLPRHGTQASPPPMVTIPAGEFWMGSTPEEREYGYGLDETLHGSTAARRHRWFEVETRQHALILPAYRIDRNLVNQCRLRAVRRCHRAPRAVRQRIRLARLPARPRLRPRPQIPVARRASRQRAASSILWCWSATPMPPPIALGAARGCRARRSGKRRRAAPTGAIFPWGDAFDAERLNSEDGGPFDTVPVGRYPNGQEPLRRARHGRDRCSSGRQPCSGRSRRGTW